MSDKSEICLMCGNYTPDDNRVGGPGQPFTFHKNCARLARKDAEEEFEYLTKELDWLRAHVETEGGIG